MPETTEPANREGQYRTILVPTDGSQGAERGIRHGLDLANQHGATIHLLHVVDEHTQGETPALSSEELVLEKFEEQAKRRMAEVVSEAEGQGLQAVAECVRGVPHAAIEQYAMANDVDVIVMGRHGAEGGRRAHVGTTTDRLVRTSRIPVLPV